MNKAFIDYFRCPETAADFRRSPDVPSKESPGFFEFGSGVVCYGTSSCATKASASSVLQDCASMVKVEREHCELPFDPDEVADNLRCERYVNQSKKPAWKRAARAIYYALRPAFPVAVRRHLQKAWLKGWEQTPFPRWPVDRSLDQMFEALMRLALAHSKEVRIPFIWFWPSAKPGCAIMTHDVEAEVGLKFCGQLMDINDSFAIKSSFQLIPAARYTVSEEQLSAMKARGFEVNVHDLKHDGHLFDEYQEFRKSAVRINESGVRFGSKGFRSAILYRNQDWFRELNFSYDMSVPNVGHLDPQRGGCCTVMPYFIGNLVEIPVTATQDYTLFHVLQTYSLDLWREQIQHIMQQHGLISFIVHPDYLDSPQARKTYAALLEHLDGLRERRGLWIALPHEVDEWWRQRSEMKLVPDGTGWRIDGPGADRATVAYATLKDGSLTYEFA
jgi:hypothetical protein